MARRLQIGIVGCGGIARAHLEAYRRADAAVTLVYDTVSAAAETFAAEAGADLAASPEAMAAGGILDAVSICTPPAAHDANCRPFLQAGIPILCEKPLAAEAQGAGRLAAAVRRSRAIFMVAFCHRFHPPIVKLQRLIKAGVLGQPLLFRNIFCGFHDIRGNHRAVKRLAGGGAMIDNSSHSVDLFRFLVGEPTAVAAMTGNLVQKIEVEDFSLLQLDMGGRAFGEITAGYSLKGGGAWVEWYGTKGRALVNYGNPGHPELSYRPDRNSDEVAVDCGDLPQRFPAQIMHFLECVQARRQPAVTVADGLKASRILAAAYRSAAAGRRIGLRL